MTRTERERDEATARAIREHYVEHGRMPSYAELAQRLGLKDKSSAARRVQVAVRHSQLSIYARHALTVEAEAWGLEPRYVLVLAADELRNVAQRGATLSSRETSNLTL